MPAGQEGDNGSLHDLLLADDDFADLAGNRLRFLLELLDGRLNG
jgi:hypothetical protein